MKSIVFVSNYFNSRIGLYVNGVLRHEEHGEGRRDGVGYSYEIGTPTERRKVEWRDTFEHAADLLTMVGTKFDWREADPSWLKRRKHFPMRLDEVKFA